MDDPAIDSAGPTTCFDLSTRIGCRDAATPRLALVSHSRHVACLAGENYDTVLVSSNWLLTQQLLNDGRPCVFWELGLLGWEPRELVNDHYLRALDWAYRDGRDVTLFHGVSLGAMFVRESSLVLADYERLARALEQLILRFKPREIVYFDFRTDEAFLDTASRLTLAGGICERLGVALIDRHDPVEGNDPELPSSHPYENTRHQPDTWATSVKVLLREIYLRAAAFAAQVVHAVRRRRPSVLMLTTALNAVPVLDAFDGQGLRPLMLAQWYPRIRDFRFLARNLAKGVGFVSLRRARLTDEDRRAVGAIERSLGEARKEPIAKREAFVRDYIRRHILKPNRLAEAALEVKRAEHVLDRVRPDLLFTDGFRSAIPTSFLELAKQRAIPAVAIWHGPYFHDFKLRTLGGDPRAEPLVGRCLTWGRSQEAWLEATGARTKSVRTGSPVCAQHSNASPRRGVGRRVLMLHYFQNYEDLASPASLEYAYFVEVLCILRELDYSDVRFRLHPGSTKAPYYRRIAKFFGIECPPFDDGAFPDAIRWCDLVIGPVFSGAMLEVLAAHRPYYPVLLPPHTLNTRYLEGSRIFTDLGELRSDLAAGTPPDLSGVLHDFTSFGEITNPAERVWAELRDECRRTAINRAGYGSVDV